METIILNIIYGILLSSFNVYCWKKLLFYNQKIRFEIKDYGIIILCTLISNISNYIFPQPFKMIVVLLLMIMINFFFVSKNLKNSIILVVISQMILAISEISFVIACSFIFENEIYELLLETLPSIILNLYILIVSLIIVRRKFIYKMYKLFCDNAKTFENIIYPLIIIFTLIIATIESHMKLSLTIVLITNAIMAIVFISIIITSSKIKEKYNKINGKYETSISSLREYEVMIDKFRVDTHENKNEFLTIRNMLKDKNNKETVIKYIDKLVDNKIKDNDKIMKKTSKIPEGGLRATIYSKLCLMDKLKINYKLNISREVRTTDLINLDEDLVLKICKILGVFLDNAIEAVKELERKEISIEIYFMDDELCIDITNNFEGNLDLDKINNTKYTTKGDDHGYGLTLVSKLIAEESSKLENEKSINSDNFTQTLKIKM